MPTLIKNGSLVNLDDAQAGDFLRQGYTQATADDISKAQTAAASGFASATPGAEGVDARNVFAQSARVAGSAIPGLTGSTTNPVGSTSGIRDGENIVKSDASKIGSKLSLYESGVRNELKPYDPAGMSQEEKDIMTRLGKTRDYVNEITSADEATIASAGVQEGRRYAPIIAQAEEERRKGLPKALIQAGKVGGLMSSQFAGGAAGTPMAGETFFGVGGKLEEIKSAYDSSINNLRMKQQEAMSAAETMARQTLRTGKQADMDSLEKHYERLKSLREDQNTLMKEKLDAIIKVQTIQEKEATKNKLIEVSPGASMFDPTTKTFIGTAPNKPTDNKPITENVNGTLLQWNPTTQSWGEIFKAEGTDKTTSDITEYNLAKDQGYTGTFVDFKKSMQKQEVKLGGLTHEERLYVNQIQDNARQTPEIKDFNGIRGSFEQGRTAYERANSGEATGIGDIVLMRTIAKITDPTTGVREEEFKTFEGAQSTLARFGVNLTEKWWKGDRLSDEGRKQLFIILEDIYKQRLGAYDSAVNHYKSQLSQAGLDPSLAVPYYIAPKSTDANGKSDPFAGIDFSNLNINDF